MGLCEEGWDIACFFAWEKKSLFLVRSKKKKVYSGKKTIGLAPLHVSSGPPLINGKLVKVDHMQLAVNTRPIN